MHPKFDVFWNFWDDHQFLKLLGMCYGCYGMIFHPEMMTILPTIDASKTVGSQVWLSFLKNLRDREQWGFNSRKKPSGFVVMFWDSFKNGWSQDFVPTLRNVYQSAWIFESRAPLAISMPFLFTRYIYVFFSRWWFQRFFIFTLTWGNDPIWLIFFRWFETTN